MHATAMEGGFERRRRARRKVWQVQCIECKWRFELDGATSGDEVNCPHCEESIRLEDPRSERRRLRESPWFSRGGRRLSRRETLRAITFTLAGGALVCAVAALWPMRYTLWDSGRDFVRDVVRAVRP